LRNEKRTGRELGSSLVRTEFIFKGPLNAEIVANLSGKVFLDFAMAWNRRRLAVKWIEINGVLCASRRNVHP
jgi:hypothetical protein